MIVEASGVQFVFPSKCACCGGYPDSGKAISATRTSGKRVIHVSTNVWTVPLCSRCLGHESLYLTGQKRRAGARIAVTLFVVLGICVCLGFGSAIGYLPSSIVGALVGILGLPPYIKLNSDGEALELQAKQSCLPSCCTVANAASFAGWSGTLNSFDFASQSYAGEFMIANRHKLVNLSPAQANWLNSVGPMRPAGTTQRAQRYRN